MQIFNKVSLKPFGIIELEKFNHLFIVKLKVYDIGKVENLVIDTFRFFSCKRVGCITLVRHDYIVF